MVRREGSSRVVSITKVIPKDWQSVIISKVKETKNIVTAKFERVT